MQSHMLLFGLALEERRIRREARLSAAERRDRRAGVPQAPDANTVIEPSDAAAIGGLWPRLAAAAACLAMLVFGPE